MAKTKQEWVDISRVKLFLQSLNGTQTEVELKNVIFSAPCSMGDIAYAMEERQFKRLVRQTGYEKNFHRTTATKINHYIAKVIGAQGCFIVLNESEKFPDDIKFVPASSLEYVLVRVGEHVMVGVEEEE